MLEKITSIWHGMIDKRIVLTIILSLILFILVVHIIHKLCGGKGFWLLKVLIGVLKKSEPIEKVKYIYLRGK